MGHPALLKYGNDSLAEFENIRNKFNILSKLPATLILANIQDAGQDAAEMFFKWVIMLHFC